jgi:carboxyl-terminal processing protease
VDSLLKPFTGRLRLSGAFFAYARKLVQHQTELGKTLIFPQEPRPDAAAGQGKVLVGQTFPVTGAVVEDFRKYLKSRDVTYDEKTFTDAEEEIRRELEREIAGAIWGLEVGVRVARKSDPAVLKAIEVMPEAARMAEGRVQAPGRTTPRWP